ncbi:MAG TPA: hypothetical protein VHB02_16205 [Acidimicrobiales bacterium]|nr:hypothetical protein [Acidimicrobiales bacterium]
MTKEEEPRRCGYCRRPLPPVGRTGRPARYCRRAHRQRAYEARRRAERAQLPPDQVVVAQADLDRLHDRLYALEAAVDDVAADLADAGPRPSAADYRAALDHLRRAADDLRGTVVDPVLV